MHALKEILQGLIGDYDLDAVRPIIDKELFLLSFPNHSTLFHILSFPSFRIVSSQ